MADLFRQVGGYCPYCGGKVNIIEGMVFDYTINESGYPELSNEEQYKVTAYCLNCNRQLIAFPNGMNEYSIYPQMNSRLKLIMLNSLNKQHCSITANKLLAVTKLEDNPFLINASYNSLNNTENKELCEEDIPF